MKLAISHGYKLLDVYEIHKYESMNGMFTSFVNNFLKMKKESSGYPQNCKTKLGDNLLYVDTDSAIFIDNGSVDIKCGDYLGDLTDKIEEGTLITEFVSTGPKSYSLKLLTRDLETKYLTKCKGFTLNSKSANRLNFKSFKDMVFENHSENNEGDLGGGEVGAGIATESFKIKRKRTGC